MKNYYLPHDRIADPEVLAEFAKVAEPTIETRHFVLWQCRAPQHNVPRQSV
jgi:hypothetical protein